LAEVGGASQAEQLSELIIVGNKLQMVSDLLPAIREVDEVIHSQGRNCGCGTLQLVGFDAM
jgi:hypothetical protein